MLKEAQGFTDLFAQEYSRVLKTISTLLGQREEAEDVTQEAFARLFIHWRKIGSYERPGAWVRRVAIRLAIDRHRVNRRRARVHVTEPSREISTSDPSLYQAILQLSGSQRASVILYYLEDHPIEEVAQLLDCSLGTVKTQLYRARQRLARILSEEEESTDVSG